MKCPRIALAVFAVLFLAGCLPWWDKSPRPNTPEALYTRGQEEYRDGNYKKAVEFFRRLVEEYPLGELAIPAELGVADSYFSDGDYATAALHYNDFMEFHPTNEHLPYVMYQIGLCHHKQIMEIDRDQTETRMAEQAFQRLLARFPSSQFSVLGEEKLRECRRMLGEHEFYVGKFYFNIGEYRAALARFEIVQKQYPSLGMDYKTSHFIRETKKRLAESEAKGATQTSDKG